MTMLTLILMLALMILSGGAVEYETRLRADLGGLFVGRILGRSIEINIARYRPGRCYVLARAW
jgi:hypothetical protein